jgi:cathepsin B
VTYDASQAAHTFGTSYKVDANVAAIQADIMAHGPVNAGMFLVAEFEVYKSGVFSTTSAAYIGAHAVTIVGWGTDTNASGKDYWLVRNSWNDEWGEKGYFRIERGKDNLAIEQSVVGGTLDKW